MSNIGERRIFPALVCNAPTGQEGSEREMISTLSISLYYVTYPKTTAVTRWRRKETGYTQNKGNCLQTSIVQKAHIFIRQNLQKPMPNIPTSQLRFHVLWYLIYGSWRSRVSTLNSISIVHADTPPLTFASVYAAATARKTSVRRILRWTPLKKQRDGLSLLCCGTRRHAFDSLRRKQH